MFCYYDTITDKKLVNLPLIFLQTCTTVISVYKQLLGNRAVICIAPICDPLYLFMLILTSDAIHFTI